MPFHLHKVVYGGLAVDDEFVKEVGDVFPHFFAVGFAVHFVSATGVEVHFGVDAVLLVEFVQFLHAFAVATHRVLVPTEHTN